MKEEDSKKKDNQKVKPQQPKKAEYTPEVLNYMKVLQRLAGSGKKTT